MIRRELFIFLIVGSSVVLIDFLIYRGLVWFSLMDVNMAKGASFLIGSVLTYYANRIWTFGHQTHAPGSAWRYTVLHIGTLGVNVWVNAQVLAFLDDAVIAVQLAFFLATGTSATLNFVGMKWFVFKAKLEPELL